MQKKENSVYVITRLNTDNIKIGGKIMKKGDAFSGNMNIEWSNDRQVMEVKDKASGVIYKFSKALFENKGQIKNIQNYFLRTTKASVRGGEIITSSANEKQVAPRSSLALVIGNSNYINLPYLPTAQEDAVVVSKLLSDSGYDIISLYETEREELIEVINSFIDISGNYESAVLFYAGHIVFKDNNVYLCPINADTGLEAGTSNDNSVGIKDLVRSEASEKICILDVVNHSEENCSEDRIREGNSKLIDPFLRVYYIRNGEKIEYNETESILSAIRKRLSL